MGTSVNAHPQTVDFLQKLILLIILFQYMTLPNTYNKLFHLEQLMYTAEYHSAQVVTVGNMTPLFFDCCPCIPITESVNKTNMYYLL
jgi:hypothetical protein